MHGQIRSTGRYSVHEIRPGIWRVLDERKLLDSLLAWPGEPDAVWPALISPDEIDDGRQFFDELRPNMSPGSGSALNLADVRVLYLLTYRAGNLADHDAAAAVRLSQIYVGATVLEAGVLEVSGFACAALSEKPT